MNPTSVIAFCCARASRGHAAAALPNSLINSRRFIAAPMHRGGHCIGPNRRAGRGLLMSALGQKQTYAVQRGMSTLPPKPDMCGALADVRYGPEADIRRLTLGRSLRFGSA